MNSKYWGMEKGPKLTRNYEKRTQAEIMPMRIRKQRWTLRFYGALNLNLDLESCLRNVRRIYAYIFFSFKDVTRERAKLRSNNLECLTLTICSLNKNKITTYRTSQHSALLAHLRYTSLDSLDH